MYSDIMPFVNKRPALEMTEDELRQLNIISKSRKQPKRAVERAKVLLRFHEGTSISQIARELGTNRPKVERTIDKAFAFGILAALEDLPRSGRSRIISSGARTWILSLACSKPLEHGYPNELWTQRLLAEHIRKHCIDNGFPELSKISRGTISKILRASNVKPHKISSYIAPIDPEFEPKSAVVLHTYKQVELLQQISKDGRPLDMIIISYDEKPGIQAVENKYKDLMPVAGKYATLSRDHEYIRHGTISLLAGIDLLTGTVHYKMFDRHRSAEFIEFLKSLDSVYPKNIKIILILDNVRVHTSKETLEYLKTVPQRFLFVFTPKHASWLNIIESLFSKMTRTMLRGIRVSSKEELIERISQYIEAMNETPTIFKWKYKMDKMAGGIVVDNDRGVLIC
jgi:transposase